MVELPWFQPNLNLSMHDDDNNAIGSPSSSFRKSLMERRKPVHEVHDLYMQAARVGSSDAKVK